MCCEDGDGEVYCVVCYCVCLGGGIGGGRGWGEGFVGVVVFWFENIVVCVCKYFFV